MLTPTVSIVMPTFNRLEHLRAAIAGQATAPEDTHASATSAWHWSLAPGTLWRHLRA
jgi:hypothetical protein